MTPETIAELLQPYIGSAPGDWARVSGQLSTYLDLILKWNARTNLTAVRSPEEIVRRHFGESLFAALQLGRGEGSLLDYGSGAGFPGIPIQLVYPELPVTLAESQHKKAAFLREVIRELNLKTQVWADRVESMPADWMFDTVALRAVDKMDTALAEASRRAAKRILVLTSSTAEIPHEVLERFEISSRAPIPGSQQSEVVMLSRR